MQQFTLAWLILDLTESISKLGLMIALIGISRISLILFMGAIADRYDRVKMYAVGQGLLLANMAVLGILTLLNAIEVWHLFIAAWLVGAVQAITNPPRISLVRDLVAREDVMNAVVLNALVMNISTMGGPAIAGLLIAQAGMAPTFFVIVGCLVAGIAALTQLRAIPRREGKSSVRDVPRDILDGFRYLPTAPVVFTVLGLAMCWGFFGQAIVQLAPAFARDILNVGSGLAGILVMGAGIGAFIGNFTLIVSGDIRHRNWVLIGAITLFPLALAGFSMASWFPLAMFFLMLAGMGSMVFDAMVNTVLQLRVPANMLGRLTSIWYLSGGLMFVGALPLGFLADSIGLRTAMLLSAITFLAIVRWLAWLRPTVRRAEMQ